MAHLPNELWIAVVNAVYQQDVSETAGTARVPKATQNLSLASHFFRGLAQPSLFRRLSLEERSTQPPNSLDDRLQGLLNMFLNRPESCSWVKNLRVFSPGDTRRYIPKVARLFLQMTQLENLEIRGFSLSCSMYSHIFHLRHLRILTYSPPWEVPHFDMGLDPRELSIQYLSIPTTARADLWLLTQGRCLTELEVWDECPTARDLLRGAASPPFHHLPVCPESDVHCSWDTNGAIQLGTEHEPNPVSLKASSDLQTLVRLTVASPEASQGGLFDLLRKLPRLEDFTISPGLTFLSEARYQRLDQANPGVVLPRLRRYSGPLAWA